MKEFFHLYRRHCYILKLMFPLKYLNIIITIIMILLYYHYNNPVCCLLDCFKSVSRLLTGLLASVITIVVAVTIKIITFSYSVAHAACYMHRSLPTFVHFF